jgi:ankyrin repeat protein
MVTLRYYNDYWMPVCMTCDAFNSISNTPLFVSGQCSLELQDNRGSTPLLAAAKFHRATCVTTLIEMGANVLTASDDGYTGTRFLSCLLRTAFDVCVLCVAAHFACRAGAADETSVLRTLLDAAPGLLEARNQHGDTPLHVCAMNGTLQAAQLLLRCGATVNTPNLYSDTPLHYAAFVGDAKMAKVMTKSVSLSTMLNCCNFICCVVVVGCRSRCMFGGCSWQRTSNCFAQTRLVGQGHAKQTRCRCRQSTIIDIIAHCRIKIVVCLLLFVYVCAVFFFFFTNKMSSLLMLLL